MKYILVVISPWLILISYFPSLAQDNSIWVREINNSQGVPFYASGLDRPIPTYIDIDADGDSDLFLGSTTMGTGTIWFYENIGDSMNAQWNLVSEQYNDIEKDCLFSGATFADIDADNDFDLFIGTWERISFWRNDGSPKSPSWTFVTNTYGNINNNHHYIRPPTFTDIDSDGDMDLFFFSQTHKLTFYRNDGAPGNAIWTFITDDYLNYPTGDADIKFVDIDGDSDLDLFIGLASVVYFRNDGTPQSPIWTFVTDNYLAVQEMSASGISFSDMDADGDFDLVVSEMDGHSHYFRNDGTPQQAIWTHAAADDYIILDIGSNSSPSFFDVDNDGDLDLFITGSERISFYRNDGTVYEPLWVKETAFYDSISHNSMSGPEFVDIDDDGDKDMFMGDFWGVIFYKNDGTAVNPIWILADSSMVVTSNPFADPAFVDIDSDGDYDLFVQNRDGVVGNWTALTFYQNTGTSSEPQWSFEYEIPFLFGSPAFFDYDRDGDYDYFCSGYNNRLFLYENIGTPQQHQFQYVGEYGDSLFLSPAVVAENWSWGTPTFVDIDADGDMDFFAGCKYGGVYFYRNEKLVGIENDLHSSPDIFTEQIFLIPNYPNPFNTYTTIRYRLSNKSVVQLQIFNLLGERTIELVNERQPAGFYEIVWDGTNQVGEILSSGIYFVKIEAGSYRKTQKVTLLK